MYYYLNVCGKFQNKNVIHHTITGVPEGLQTFFELVDFHLQDLILALKLREGKLATHGGWNFPSHKEEILLEMRGLF